MDMPVGSGQHENTPCGYMHARSYPNHVIEQ